MIQSNTLKILPQTPYSVITHLLWIVELRKPPFRKLL